MPVIPATQEAEIRRIMVGNQPQANTSQDSILKKTGVQTPVLQNKQTNKKIRVK
jgi:hypothetical protein